MTARRASILATAVVLIAVVWLLQRHALIGTGAVAIALQVVAVALMAWARLTFGRRSYHFAANPTAGGLVTVGPYRFWRHPIYASILLFVWSGVLSHAFNPLSFALAAVATLATGVRIAAEEQLLRSTFPEYAAYAGRTKRLIPFVF